MIEFRWIETASLSDNTVTSWTSKLIKLQTRQLYYDPNRDGHFMSCWKDVQFDTQEEEE